MRKDYEKLFTYLESPEPSPELFGRIMGQIHKEQKEQSVARLNKRIALFSIIFAVSIAAFVPAYKILRAGFTDSGFIEYFSLIFSDSEIILSSWQNYAMLLLEALPVGSLIIFSFVVLVFLESLNFLAKDLNAILNSKKFIFNIYGHK